MRTKDDPSPNASEQTEETLYGLPYTSKASDVIRVWYTNPCGIGVNPNHLKSDDSFSFLRSKSKCDVFGLAETNVHWKKLYGHASLYARIKQRWRYFKTSTSHNKHANLGKTQRGGTCTVAVGQAAYRVYQAGQDDTGLGRWSWLEFRGRDNWCTRVYTAYRPGSKPSGDTEGTTVYHQHARYLRRHKLDKEPRNYFDECIIQELQEQLSKCNIILMIDVNQNVLTGHFNDAMNELGLRNCMDEIVEEPLPATHHRGSKPISAIYISSMIHTTRVGILPKGQGVYGDHRNMYADFTTASMLGTYMYQIVSPPMKRLQLRDSRTVRRFVAQLRKHVAHNDLSMKGFDLVNTSGYPTTSTVMALMEDFDSQLGRGIDSAKKKCRKYKTGAIPFSDTFANLRDEYRLWLLVRKKLLGQVVSNTTIRRLSKRLNIQKPMCIPLQEATKLMYSASKQYQEFSKQHAREGRNTFYEALATANAMSSNQSKTKILERIIRDEKQREQTILNRKYFPKRNAPSQKVDRIQFQQGQATVEVSKPRSVLKACQDDTKSKYSETSSTPLMDPVMHQTWGNFAETSYSRSLQNHKTSLPLNAPPAMKAMLERTQHEVKIPRLPILMSSTEIKSAWSKVKEHKATSPSGRYNGIYKAMTKHDDLLKLLTYSTNLPFITGYPYDRWRNMIDIMAFKKPDNIHVSNIRSIIISEADWNTSGKIHVTRRMMRNAENCNLLPEEHIGGRKGKKATDGVLTKRLFIDNARIMERTVAIISTDAANCYDRMTHKYISLMCIKWGLAVQVMVSLLQPLQRAKHHTRTAFGDSTSCFEGSNLQGAGQGNTGAAPYWTSVSTPMIEEMKKQNMHSKMVSPISGIVVILALLAFVDDTELFIMHNTDSEEEVIKKAQSALLLWRALLNVTGGIMRSKKCAWTLMSFKPNSKTSAMKCIDEVPGRIALPDEDGEVRFIERYDHDHPREYLGVIQTTSGSEAPQLARMQREVRKWNILMESSRLPPVLNLQVTLSKIHRTLSYPLPALSLPESDLQELSDTLYWKTLPKCGIVQTFPIYARHLPYKYQGLNLPNLYLEQEISKVKELLNFSSKQDITSQQIRLGLEAIQMQLGVTDIIFNYAYDKYQSLVQSSWLKSLWCFLSRQGYTIKGWTNVLQFSREEDKCIMEEIICKNEPTEIELSRINQCRVYLQAWSLSDIVDGNGEYITSKAYNGYRDESRVSKLHWKEHKRPHYVCWYEWRKYLSKTFSQNENDRKLIQALGPWIQKSHQKWEWYFQNTDKKLYRKMQNHVRQYQLARSCRSSSRYGTNWYKIVSIKMDDEIDLTDAVPATICETAKGYTYVKTDGWSYTRSIPTNVQVSSHLNLLQILRNYQLPQWIATYGNLNTWSYAQTKSFLQKDLRIVSDGSYEDGKGAACTIIESVDKLNRMVFTTNVPANTNGKTCSNDAYRSELFGLYSGFHILHLLEEIFMVHTKAIVSCDNDTALMVTAEYTYISSNVKHFDVIKSIIYFRDKLRSHLEYETVIGHAKEKNLGRKLNRTEELNDMCDEIAKFARRELSRMGPVCMQGEGLSLWHKSEKFYTAVDIQMRNKFYAKKAQSAMQHKYKWNSIQFSSIDWEAYEKATKMMHSSTLLKIAKCVTKTLPVGETMVTRNQWHHPFCSRCNHPSETIEHIYQCPQSDSRRIMGESIMRLDEWLEKVSTEPNLHSQLLLCISQWVTGTPLKSDATFITPIQTQIKLGWFHLMQGRIHSSFSTYMQDHYTKIHSQKKGVKWVSTLIQKLWTELFNKQWEHRNKCVHGRDKATKTTRENQNLQLTVRTLYNLEKQSTVPLLSQDRHLMERPLTELLHKPTAQKRAWIEDIKLATADRDETHENEIRPQITFMYNYLHSVFLPNSRIPRATPPTPLLPHKKKRRVSSRPRRRFLRAHEITIKRPMRLLPRNRKQRVSIRPRRRILRAWERAEMIRKHRFRNQQFFNHKRWNQNGSKNELFQGSWKPP